MDRQPVDRKDSLAIMTPEEVAQFLGKSTSWVYKNWRELGGRKLVGSLLFPSKEDLYERLFQQEKGLLGVRFSSQQKTVHRVGLQHQAGCSEGRSPKKGGGDLSNKDTGDGRNPDRYGLSRFMQ
jgi:predicted DNA-binding transcriptional regulator AlpA